MVEARAIAARRMMAEDARWIGDAMLSTQSGAALGGLALVLLGHSSRIVYEGFRALNSSTIRPDVEPLAQILPAEHSSVITNARHATKFLDDSKRSFENVLEALNEVLIAHQAEFLGNSVKWARFLETDLGLFSLRGQLIGATVPLAFRSGVPVGLTTSEVGSALRGVAEEQGGILAVLAAVDLAQIEIAPTINYVATGRLSSKDVRIGPYLSGRYDPRFSDNEKLLLLMLESEIGTTSSVLPITSPSHTEAVFRARFVSVFHTVSSIRAILERHPDTVTPGASQLRSLLGDRSTVALLSGPGPRQLRNRCVHYEITDPRLAIRLDAPMFGFVETFMPALTLEQLDRELKGLSERLTETLAVW